jgi:hypothetical protein
VDHLSEEDIRTIGSRSTWRSLSEDKRREFIQHLVNTIGAQTGNPNIPVTYQTRAQGGPEFAQYDQNTGTIVINPESSAYRNRRDLINTIGHEIRHEYQKSPRGMESTDVDNIVWRNNNDPADLYEDPSKYAAQYNERDAASYGNKIVNQVNRRIHTIKQQSQASGTPAPSPPRGSK